MDTGLTSPGRRDEAVPGSGQPFPTTQQHCAACATPASAAGTASAPRAHPSGFPVAPASAPVSPGGFPVAGPAPTRGAAPTPPPRGMRPQPSATATANPPPTDARQVTDGSFLRLADTRRTAALLRRAFWRDGEGPRVAARVEKRFPHDPDQCSPWPVGPSGRNAGTGTLFFEAPQRVARWISVCASMETLPDPSCRNPSHNTQCTSPQAGANE